MANDQSLSSRLGFKVTGEDSKSKKIFLEYFWVVQKSATFCIEKILAASTCPVQWQLESGLWFEIESF